MKKIVSFWYGTDGISWFINEINGRSLFSIKCDKRLVTPPEVRVFQLVSIEVNYTFIQTIWIIVSVGLFMIFPWVLSLLIPSWKCSLLVFSKSTFLSVRYESVRIDVFMLFVQIISNSKNTAYKNCKFGICDRSCCHSNCFEIIT